MITDENGIEHEHRALSHLYKTIPDSMNDRWVQTSYNNNFRVRYAGIGYSYNESLDAFISPKPHNSWILNETTADWEAPVPKPDDGNLYEWDENLGNWKEII
jgi:hypothetical protein